MDLKLSQEQEILQRGARRFFGEQAPIQTVRSILDSDNGFSPDLWRAMAELGWLGVIIPEEYGGSGGTFMDLIVLLQEMGRARIPSPYFATMALAAIAILDLGSADQKRKYLPAIAKGESIFSLALVEEEGTYDPASIHALARREGSNYRINGVKLFVPYGLAADSLICVTRENDENSGPLSSFILDARQAGVYRSRMQTLTDEFYAEVRLDEAIVGESERLTAGDGGWDGIRRVMLKAAVARCAMAVGGAEHVLDITVQYAKDRVQFGRPIGSFQAIQHHCADMITAVDACRLITYDAAFKISNGMPYELEAAMAKAYCGRAYEQVTRLGHQVHGGVALIKEHAMHLYTRDARSTEATLGNTDEHHEIIAGFLREMDTLP